MEAPKLITVTDDVADDILLNVWDKDEEDVFVMNMDLVKQEIQKHAYYKWEAAGRPSGRSLDSWLEAEREICDVLGLYLPTIPKQEFMLV
jgi:hypothetical protein